MPFVIPFIVEAVAVGITASTGAVLSAGAFAALEVGVGLAFTAGSVVASSALQRSMMPDLPGDTGGNALASLNAPGVKASVKQATPFQRICYGPQRFGGAFAFYKAKPGKLYIQHMYSRRKLMQIQKLNVNGNQITFQSSAFGSILTPLAVDGMPNYPARLRVCFQDGRLNQATNPLIREAFPDLPEGWRLPGIANGVYEFTYGTDYDEFVVLWGNVRIPDVEPEVLGAPVYDPRDPTQWLPTDPNDIYEWYAAQESWKYSDNAKLIQADYLWQGDGLNAGPAGVRWDKVAEAARRDDEAAATRSGLSERRYTIGGVVTLDQQTAAVFDGLLTASRSSMVQGNDGTAWPSSDAPKQPVFVIRDGMLAGAVSYQGFKGERDIANKTSMRFVAPGRKGQLSDGPTLIRADLIAEDGQEIRLSVSLPYTPSPSTAQRIAKADLEETRIERSWSGVLKLTALGIREDDCIEIASEICPHWNGLYVVDKWSLALSLSGNSGIGVSLVGYDPAIANDWNAESDDQPFELIDAEELLAA